MGGPSGPGRDQNHTQQLLALRDGLVAAMLAEIASSWSRLTHAPRCCGGGTFQLTLNPSVTTKQTSASSAASDEVAAREDR